MSEFTDHFETILANAQRQLIEGQKCTIPDFEVTPQQLINLGGEACEKIKHLLFENKNLIARNKLLKEELVNVSEQL